MREKVQALKLDIRVIQISFLEFRMTARMCFILPVFFANLVYGQLVDDFSRNTLDSNWIKSTAALNGDGLDTKDMAGDHEFETQSVDGFLAVANPTYAGTAPDTAHQQLLLRDDVSLQVGQTLIAEFGGVFESISGTPSTVILDTLGICVAQSTKPGGRSRILFNAYFGTIDNFVAFDFFKDFEFQRVDYSAKVLPPGNFRDLFIERVRLNEFSFGYFESGEKVTRGSFVTQDFCYGTAIGFWADIRIPSTAVFDAIRIEGAGLNVGDVNLDGSVNLLDVAPFVDLLADGQFQLEADTNSDGIVNLLDVTPFIQILANCSS